MPSIGYSPLGEDDREGFCCGDSEIDKWYRNKAYKDHCSNKHIVTCASFVDGDGVAMGFYALSSVIEEARKLPEVKFFPFTSNKFFPCVQLVYLGVHKPYQRQPERYGSTIMGEVIRSFAYSGSIVGLPALILVPISRDVASFYNALGFEPYDKDTRMFLPLEAAVAVVEEMEAASEAEEEAGTQEG